MRRYNGRECSETSMGIQFNATEKNLRCSHFRDAKNTCHTIHHAPLDEMLLWMNIYLWSFPKRWAGSSKPAQLDKMGCAYPLAHNGFLTIWWNAIYDRIIPFRVFRRTHTTYFLSRCWKWDWILRIGAHSFSPYLMRFCIWKIIYVFVYPMISP